MLVYYVSMCIFLLFVFQQRWLKTRDQKEANVLRNAFKKVYDDVHIYVQQKLIAKMKLLEAIYIRYIVNNVQ